MFFVLLAGTIVTKFDAGDGCGTDWPLCNGKFVPAYTIPSIIEYSHRVVSGVVGLLVLAAFVLVLLYARDRKDSVFYASGSLFFTVFQAILGAMAVVWPQSDAVLALHFGFSLIAFALTVMLVVSVRRKETHLPTPHRFSSGYRFLVWLSVIFCYVVVYTGAFVRHTESFAGCTDWPLCNGQLIPELSGAAGIVFLHRITVVVMFILVVILIVKSMAKHMPQNMRKASILALITMLLQTLSGAVVTFTLSNADVYVFTALVHTMIIGALFSVLFYMTVEVWRSGRAEVKGTIGTAID